MNCTASDPLIITRLPIRGYTFFVVIHLLYMNKTFKFNTKLLRYWLFIYNFVLYKEDSENVEIKKKFKRNLFLHPQEFPIRSTFMNNIFNDPKHTYTKNFSALICI